MRQSIKQLYSQASTNQKEVTTVPVDFIVNSIRKLKTHRVCVVNVWKLYHFDTDNIFLIPTTLQ